MDRTAQSYQHLVEEIYPRLVELISQRYQKNWEKSLQDVYRLDPDFLAVDPQGLQFMVEHRQEVVEILADPELRASLVRLFLLSTLEFTFANNQFVQVSRQNQAELAEIYQSYLMRMAEVLKVGRSARAIRQPFAALVANHFGRLRANLDKYLDAPQEGEDGEQAIFNQVVSRQYSPVFQLETLGLQVEHMGAPVLDLGCGQAGRLVKYLRAYGLQAEGIDRIVEPDENLHALDWLEARLAPDYYGTILSHMAFSNHFIFHHLYKRGNPRPYARQYMAILQALKPGGSFCYTPGLPFIEALLPAEQYRVERKPVTLEGAALEAHEDLLYAARVTRLAPC